MGKFFDAIPDSHFDWIKKQEMFFVATAPLTGDGHVNVSPKGGRGCFHVVDANKVWYEDFTGSGIETISHLREEGNGRITIMFCAYVGAPRIMRLFGKGTVLEFGTPEFEELVPKESRKVGVRAAIVIDVHKVGTSCGYSVPYYTFKSHRTILSSFADKLEKLDIAVYDDPQTEAKKHGGGLKAYWKNHNTSIDGLPGMRTAPECEDRFIDVVLDLEALKRGQYEGHASGNDAEGQENLKGVDDKGKKVESGVKTAQTRTQASVVNGNTLVTLLLGIAIGVAVTALRSSLAAFLPIQ